jgi:hypothetical protein
MDPVWDEMADAEEDLDQYSYYMDTLKERFLNLIELVSRHCLAFQRRVLTWFTGVQYRERQSVRLLAILVNHCSSIPATHISHCEYCLQVIVPRAYCRLSNRTQSIFGISTLTTPPAILCLYISIPLLIVSLLFTIFFPWAIRRFQKLWYPVDNNNVKLPKSSFTMLSEELPAVSNASSTKLPQTC